MSCGARRDLALESVKNRYTTTQTETQTETSPEFFVNSIGIGIKYERPGKIVRPAIRLVHESSAVSQSY